MVKLRVKTVIKSLWCKTDVNCITDLSPVSACNTDKKGLTHQCIVYYNKNKIIRPSDWGFCECLEKNSVKQVSESSQENCDYLKCKKKSHEINSHKNQNWEQIKINSYLYS